MNRQMSYVKWQPAMTVNYVLDITASSGGTQMFMATLFPGGDGSVLTQADADGTASALRAAVNALSGVTGSVLTTADLGGGQPTFDSSEWASYQFMITAAGSYAGNVPGVNLVTASPADGVLSSADISTVTAAVLSYLEGMSGVTGSGTVTQQVVTPATL